MENIDWISVVFNLLATVGGSSIVAAALPLKWRQYLPILTGIIDVVAANFGTAQNKEPSDIEVDRQILKARRKKAYERRGKR